MKCFLIMPYGHHCDEQDRRDLDALHRHIRDIVMSIEVPGEGGGSLECIRGDSEARPAPIVDRIVRDLVESEIAIAVLSLHNSNVFYELGIRHAVAGNTILLAENGTKVPFDLQTQRLIYYSTNSLAASQKLEEDLVTALREIVANLETGPDNPVGAFLANRKLKSPQQLIDERSVVEIVAEMQLSHRSQMQELMGYVTPMMEKLVSMEAVIRQQSSNQISNESECVTIAVKKAANKTGDSLARIAGTWINEESGTHAYADMVAGNWFVVYCYGGNNELTGVYHDIQCIGDRIYARFYWENNPAIQGFSLMNILNDNTLSGGWWFADSVSKETTEQLIPQIADHPGMVPTEWKKIEGCEMPAWASDWFERATKSTKSTKSTKAT